MKKWIIIGLLLCLSSCLLIPRPALSDGFGDKGQEVTEVDGSPDDWPKMMIWPNGSLTDNGDSSFSVNINVNNTDATLSSLNVTGNATIGGNITADFFLGNGSLLTGIVTDFHNWTSSVNGGGYNLSNVTNITVPTISSLANLTLSPVGNSIIVPNGTTIRPVSDGRIYFANDTNVSKLMINTSSGFVGIGTTAPVAKLDVAGNIRSGGYIILTSNEGISGNGDLWLSPHGAGDTYGEVRVTQGGVQTFKNATGITQVIFNNNNVGIGIVAPATLLDVNGTGNFTTVNATTINQGGQPVVNNTTAFLGEVTGTVGAMVLTDNSSIQYIQVQNGTTAVGTNPIINFVAGANTGFVITNDTANGRFNVTINATSGAGGGGNISGLGAENYIPRFRNTTDLNMSQLWDNGTMVGIGTTAPTAKLTVAGNIEIGDYNLTKLSINLLGGNSTQNNVFLGNNTHAALTTGHNNTIIGNDAGKNITSGRHNNLIGYQVGYNITEGFHNNLIGVLAGQNISTGYQNNIIGGFRTGQSITSGFRNNFIGYRSGHTITTASGNNLIGVDAGYNITTGSDNVILGSSSGLGIITGVKNILLGFQANFTGDWNDSIAIGTNATAGANYTCVLGGTGADAVKVGIGLTTPLTALDVVGTGNFTTINATDFYENGVAVYNLTELQAIANLTNYFNVTTLLALGNLTNYFNATTTLALQNLTNYYNVTSVRALDNFTNYYNVTAVMALDNFTYYFNATTTLALGNLTNYLNSTTANLTYFQLKDSISGNNITNLSATKVDNWYANTTSNQNLNTTSNVTFNNATLTGVIKGYNFTKTFAFYNITNSSDVKGFPVAYDTTIIKARALCTGGNNVTGELLVRNATGATPVTVNANWTIENGTIYEDTSFTNATVTKDFYLGWNTSVVNGAVNDYTITLYLQQ